MRLQRIVAFFDLIVPAVSTLTYYFTEQQYESGEKEDRQLGPLRGSSSPFFGALSQLGLYPIKLASIKSKAKLSYIIVRSKA